MFAEVQEDTQPVQQEKLPGFTQPVQQEKLPGLTQPVQQEKLPGFTQPVQQEKLPGLTQPVQQEKLPGLTQPVQQEKLRGFTSEQKVKVTYKGLKSSVDMKKNGLQVQFEGNQSGDRSNTTISISTGSVAPSRFSHKLKPVSRVYDFSCSKKLKTPVTIRIKHEAPDDVQNLCFVTCDENQPDHFKIIRGGTFTRDYGELVVSKLSWYTIGRLFSRFRVRGILSVLEKSYESSLYCSSTLHQLPFSRQYCDIYLSVVKNCGIFKKCVENYIKEEYREDVKLVSRHVVHFNDKDRDVTVHYTCVPTSESVHLDEPDRTYLHKLDISSYVDACPPYLKFRLNFEPDKQVEVKFKLEGFKNTETHTLRSSHLPGITM